MKETHTHNEDIPVESLFFLKQLNPPKEAEPIQGPSRARAFLPRVRARSRGASIAGRASEGWHAEPPISRGVNPKRREIGGFMDSYFSVRIPLNYYRVRGRE